MRAAQYTSFSGPLEIIDIPEPECPADGVIVEVHACGVCRTDWHAWKGAHPTVKPPHIPGHEFAGIVIEVGSEVRRVQKGQRVTAPFILSCGQCHDCMGGEPTICDNQVVIGFSRQGAFCERVAVPRADFNLVALPDALDFAIAAGMGCRVTTAFKAVIDRAGLAPGETLAVHGCGGIGLSAIQIASAIGARTIALDISDDALAMAKSMGANETLNVSGVENVGEAVRDLTNGGADVSIDAVGNTIAFHNSLESLRKLGRHVQIGLPTGKHAEPTIKLMELVYMRQLDIKGTRGMAANRFPTLFNMIDSGQLSLDALITKRISLDEATPAMAAFDTGELAGVTVIDRF